MPDTNFGVGKPTRKIEPIVDPASISADGSAAPSEPEHAARRNTRFTSESARAASAKRGHKAGAGKTTSGAAPGASLDLSALAGVYVALHGMLAGATGNPEWLMEQSDGDRMALAWSNVARHYDIKTTQKTLDWIAAGAITATIYYPRFFAIRRRHQAEAAARRRQNQQPGAVVYPFAVPTPEPGPLQ